MRSDLARWRSSEWQLGLMLCAIYFTLETRWEFRYIEFAARDIRRLSGDKPNRKLWLPLTTPSSSARGSMA